MRRTLQAALVLVCILSPAAAESEGSPAPQDAAAPEKAARKPAHRTHEAPRAERVRSGGAALLGGGAPANDVCGGAQVVPTCPAPGSSLLAFPKITTSVDVSAATPDGDPNFPCRGEGSAGVWYAFTPPLSGKYRITTCQNEAPGTTVPDTSLAVFGSKSNACPEGSRITCNNDDTECAGHEFQSTVKATLEAGKTYFIVAYATDPAPGATIQLSIDRDTDLVLPNGGFERGDFDGWQVVGAEADLAIVPREPAPACFQPDMPSEGCFMACLSTGSFFGGEASGDVRSDLISDPIGLPFRPGKIKVTFSVDFQTEESIPSIAFNDAFEARLVTRAGTFPIVQIDTFGVTPPGRGLNIPSFEGYVTTSADCSLDGFRTKRLSINWTKTLDPELREHLGNGPIFVEFSIADQGNPDRLSIVCVDDVQIRLIRPSE